MTHRRTTLRRPAAAVAGAAALLAGALTAGPAHAGPPTAPDTAPAPAVLTPAQAGTLAGALAADLADRTAGSYYDTGSRTLVVNITEAADAPAVAEAGARPRVVEHGPDDLERARDRVADTAVPGTAWGVDPVTNAVRVTVDSTVSGRDLDALRALVEDLDGAAVLDTAEGAFRPFLAGGEAIYASEARCSLGFNVTVGDRPGFLTAGHCGPAGSTWSDTAGGDPIGTMRESVFPEADYALVEYTAEVDHPSAVDLHDGTTQEITGAAEATVGMAVRRSGSTTGVHDGTVTALDVSVSYPQGTVHGTIQTDVCSEPGDSGGALFSGSEAVGLTSGGNGDCTAGGTTFFYPVTDALAAVGATIP